MCNNCDNNDVIFPPRQQTAIFTSLRRQLVNAAGTAHLPMRCALTFDT